MCPSSRYTTYGDLYFSSLYNKLQYEPLQISRHSQGPNQIYRVLQILNFYAVRSPQMHELSPIMTTFRGVICRGSCFHSGSQCSICGQHQGLVDVASYLPLHLVQFAMCVGFSQPPILASVQSVIHRSC